MFSFSATLENILAYRTEQQMSLPFTTNYNDLTNQDTWSKCFHVVMSYYKIEYVVSDIVADSNAQRTNTSETDQ